MASKKVHCDCLHIIKPGQDTLEVINNKWKLPIIISIREGNIRFTDIQNSIPCISPKVLGKELKELEHHKLIKRIIIDDYPIKIVYKLEIYAYTLCPIINAMKDWGINHIKMVIGKESDNTVLYPDFINISKKIRHK